MHTRTPAHTHTHEQQHTNRRTHTCIHTKNFFLLLFVPMFSYLSTQPPHISNTHTLAHTNINIHKHIQNLPHTYATTHTHTKILSHFKFMHIHTQTHTYTNIRMQTYTQPPHIYAQTPNTHVSPHKNTHTILFSSSLYHFFLFIRQIPSSFQTPTHTQPPPLTHIHTHITFFF